MAKRRLTIAVDLDGTLIQKTSEGEILPVPGAENAMRQLRHKGYRIVIHSCRPGLAQEDGHLEEEIELIETILDKFNIPYDEIFMYPKLVADLYIDDRALRFEGNWDLMGKQIHQLMNEVIDEST